MKLFSRVLFFLCVACSFLKAQHDQNQNRVFQHGEELRYKVNWNFIRLGTITVRSYRDNSMGDTTLLRLQMIVESNPDLVFVSIQEFNESLMKANSLLSKSFYAKHCNSNKCKEFGYSYDEKTRRAFIVEGVDQSSNLIPVDTLKDVSPYVDGPSLFYFTRSKARTGNRYRVQTLADGKLASTILDFSLPAEEIEIDAIGHPIRCRKYTGVANWKGGTSAGLTGEFTGWISDDEAAILLVAKVEVFLGSIKLELESWKRSGWYHDSGIAGINNKSRGNQ